MSVSLLIAAIVITACVIFSKLSSRLGIPALLAFILLGMFFGSDGVVKIQFDNYAFTEQICTIALVFIMFYGGAGTNLNEAKKVAGKSVLLSSLGTVLTAGFVGLFCHFVLKISVYESFLIGSVISSTDAASVFSILRSKRLNLKYDTASLLEVESGSNDPFSYMLTVVMLTLMQGEMSGAGIAYMLFAQLAYGIVFGLIVAYITTHILKRFNFNSDGLDSLLLVAVALSAYAIPTLIGGNGYLSVYITGIILGNTRIKNKRSLIHFFDGITGLMQMLLFFILGLLSFPSQFSKILLPALGIAVFLTFIARPVAVFLLLSPLKCTLKQCLLISWAGLRGAASIVFAIMTVVSPAVTDNDIFHMVFFIVLFSILIQGTLLPYVAKRLNMTDDSGDVMKTFTDYAYELPVSFIQFQMHEGHHWIDQKIKDIALPLNLMLVLIIRGEEKIIPNGMTELKNNDKVILCGRSSEKIDGVQLFEREISASDEWCGKPLKEISTQNELIIMIKRGERLVIPDGNTVIQSNDIIIINESN